MGQEKRTAPMWLKLLLQDALLVGHIPPEVRGVAVGYSESEKPILNIYYDQEPNEDDRKQMHQALGEFCVEPVLGPEDLPEEVNFRVAQMPVPELETLDDFIYLRRD